MNNALNQLFTITDATSARCSTWDRTGGNNDWVTIKPGETYTIAEINGPGCIRHIYATTIHINRLEYRWAVLRMYWDGEETPSVEVPFGAVADATIDRGFSAIRRTDRQRVVTVTAEMDRSIATPEQVLAAFREWAPTLAERYPNVSYRFGGEQREQADAAGSVLRGFVMALVLIYVLLAIPLGSYLQPFIIMAVIPFGFVGALLGHWLLGWDLIFFSLLGIVALSGVVVNASLVMVHTINSQAASGKGFHEAIHDAAILRFRPIVLTTATTFFGLLSLMFESSVPALPFVPMAISLGFGVLYAAIMTLFLVPVGYVILDDLIRWRSGAGTRESAASEAASATGPAVGELAGS